MRSVKTKKPSFTMCEKWRFKLKVVHPAGLEPTTYCSGGKLLPIQALNTIHLFLCF